MNLNRLELMLGLIFVKYEKVSKLELNHLCSDYDKYWHVLRTFFENNVVYRFNDILVYKTFCDDHEGHLKCVLDNLGKQNLILVLNKNMCYMYDVGFLVSVVSIQDIQVQYHWNAMKKSKHNANHYEIGS